MTTPTRFAFTLSLAALAGACSSGHDPMATTLGAAGGTITSRSGITLKVPSGALARETELRIVEHQPGEGAMARVTLEPRGLALASPATLSFKVEDGNVKVTEIEHAAEGEVRHQLEKRRHDAVGEVEIEVEHLGEVELEHGLTCEVACDAGFECDDGVCQADDVGDDHGVDPAPAPVPAPVDDKGQHGPGHP